MEKPSNQPVPQELYESFAQFSTEDQAFDLLVTLDNNDIPYHLEDNKLSVDPTFANSTMNDRVVVKIRPNDFEQVKVLLKEEAEENYEILRKQDYYLFNFGNEELEDIIEEQDKWHVNDIFLAQKLLGERGITITDEELKQRYERRLDKIRTPKSGNIAQLYGSFVLGLLGSTIGVYFFFIFGVIINILPLTLSWYYSRSTDIDPSGFRYEIFDKNTRQKGQLIFYASIISGIIGLVLLFLLTNNQN